MASKLRVGAMFIPVVLALTLVPVGGETAPAWLFKCVGSGTFSGSSTSIGGGSYWDWSFGGRGTCTKGAAIYTFRISSAWRFHYGVYPGPVTRSPDEPWPNWRIVATMDSGADQLWFDQVWLGLGQGPFRIHAADPSYPHPNYQGLTGVGVMIHRLHTGPWANPTVKAVFAFVFGPREAPVSPPV